MQKDRYKECFTINSVNMSVSRKYKKIARNKEDFGKINGNFICKSMIIYKNIQLKIQIYRMYIKNKS